jgi:hypothetical protein
MDGGAAGGAAQAKLFAAAGAGDLAGIEAALAAGADVNGLSEPTHVYMRGEADKRTPLEHAVDRCKPGAVQLLLERGARVTTAGEDGRHAFAQLSWRTAASRGASLAIARLLLAAGAALDTPTGLTWVNETQLMVAAEVGYLPAVRLLLEAGANATHSSLRRMGPLHRAAGCGSADGNPAACVEALLDAGAGAAVGAVDIGGATPLHHAAESCEPRHLAAVVRLLVAAGADVNTDPLGAVEPERAAGTPLTALVAKYRARMHAPPLAALAAVLLAVGAEPGPCGFWCMARVRSLPRLDKAKLLGEAAWARRGHLCRLRRRVNPNSEQAAADEAKAAAAESSAAAAGSGPAEGAGGMAPAGDCSE